MLGAGMNDMFSLYFLSNALFTFTRMGMGFF